MLRKVLVVLQMGLLCTSLQAQEIAPPDEEWSSLKIKLSALKTWGTKQYTYSAREPGGKATKIIGTITLPSHSPGTVRPDP